MGKLATLSPALRIRRALGVVIYKIVKMGRGDECFQVGLFSLPCAVFDLYLNGVILIVILVGNALKNLKSLALPGTTPSGK